jgi:hypothetical protein
VAALCLFLATAGRIIAPRVLGICQKACDCWDLPLAVGSNFGVLYASTHKAAFREIVAIELGQCDNPSDSVCLP